MITKTMIALAATAAMASSAHAALYARGGGLIYDSDLNITWLANANLAATNDFGVANISGGNTTWNAAQTWVGAMNAADYLGFNNWRLPTVFQTNATCSYDGPGTYSYSCSGNETGSELGHLFYNELGGAVGTDLSVTHNANYALFQNIQARYWTGTEYAPSYTASGGYWYSWDFYFPTGENGASFKGNSLSVWVVRDGDVAAVPEPDVYVTMVVGLAVIGTAVRLQQGHSNA